MNDEKLLGHLRRMRRAQMMIGAGAIVFALAVPALEQAWARQHPIHVTAQEQAERLARWETVRATTPLEIKLKKLCTSFFETEYILIRNIDILLSLALAGPLLVLGIAVLNERRLTGRLLTIIERKEKI